MITHQCGAGIRTSKLRFQVAFCEIVLLVFPPRAFCRNAGRTVPADIFSAVHHAAVVVKKSPLLLTAPCHRFARRESDGTACRGKVTVMPCQIESARPRLEHGSPHTWTATNVAWDRIALALPHPKFGEVCCRASSATRACLDAVPESLHRRLQLAHFVPWDVHFIGERGPGPQIVPARPQLIGVARNTARLLRGRGPSRVGEVARVERVEVQVPEAEGRVLQSRPSGGAKFVVRHGDGHRSEASHGQPANLRACARVGGRASPPLRGACGVGTGAGRIQMHGGTRGTCALALCTAATSASARTACARAIRAPRPEVARLSFRCKEANSHDGGSPRTKDNRAGDPG